MSHTMRLLSLLAICLCATTAFAGSADKRLDVYWIDVEGGAATLIVTPLGESVLIDSGNAGHRDPSRIVKVATEVAKLRQIDHLITTHYHSDHFGGASTLATLLPIKNVYDNGKFETQKEFPTKDYLEFKCDKRVTLNPGDKIPLADLQTKKDAPAPSLQCLGTRQKFLEPAVSARDNTDVCASAKTKDRDGSDNANSVVMLLTFGKWRFFDAGDLTWNVEEKLVCPKNLVGKVDVYQVTHHGLDASNNPLVLRSLEPTVAIMNNGTTKGCMPEVFATLTEQKSIAAIYQMHKNLRDDGATNNVADEYIANAAKDCTGEYVHLSVDPDGKTYTVSIPANQHKRTFKTRQ
jgi:competence protein ComEC